MFAMVAAIPCADTCGNAPGRIRTCDLALRRRALYPLSYGRFGEAKSSRRARMGQTSAEEGDHGQSRLRKTTVHVSHGVAKCQYWK